MLTTLSTVKSRLAIPESDTQYDTLLTNAIKAVSTRFDKETNRTLARTESAAYEFDPDDTELLPPCYPIESVARFESKTSESTGWQEITPAPDHLIRSTCIISLPARISYQLSVFSHQSSALFRAVYTGGYVLPGDPDYQLSTIDHQLPADLEQAAVEQAAEWFQNRENLGLKTYWPTGVAYKQFTQLPFLPSVRQVLGHYRRFTP